MIPKRVTNLTPKHTTENSEDTIYSKLVKCEPGDEIVIAGISGVYPKADNINELAEKLWSKEDLVSEIACQEEDGLSPSTRYGKINEERIYKFDSNFFKIPMYGADAIDPQSRVLLELAYEAVMDAGYNPEYLRGTRTGVFVSLYRSDSSESWIYEKNSSEGLGFYGHARSMMGSRISFAMGLTGPINAIDSACASSFAALDCAIKNIRTGVCDAAIVAGCNLLLNWQLIKRWHVMGMVSPEGKCQTFSETANGYCRSEAIVALLIQKKKDARRMYAEVVHIKMNNNGDKAGAIERTSDTSQIELLREFYSECRVDPTTLNFVELHGTGTKIGDIMEAIALDKIFCGSGRKIPLTVGCIKSNMGHSEAVSGLCSISKAILMFERDTIPPNLHFYEPRSEITALKEGRIRVITELEPFFDDLIAITNLGYGGSNGHLLLRRNIKHKINNSIPTDNLQRLIPVSGRTEKSVQKIFNKLIGKPIDSEFVRLLHGIFTEDIPNLNYRGYILLNSNGKQTTKYIEKFSGEKRPVWFIFRGMGSQYPTMGRSLLNLPITRESIHKSHKLLNKMGLNLMEILTKDDPKIFDDILHSFVGIAAMQIALIDLLKAIGINPDGMIGHSVGELGCAYADDCFTAEQMILAAYYRGKVSNETSLEPGYMASVGLQLDQLQSLLPHDIDIACHNAPDNYSVSGPQKSIRRFSTSLDEDGIFVREINVSNIAYHSRYITPAAPALLSAMQMVVPDHKLRSEKWISSSVPEAEWNTQEARNSCAEYYVNNLKNCVYFEEACRHIPNNAITIEISPHGFFQSLIKRSPNLQITNVPLLSRNHPNGLDFLFCALGRLYTLGVNPVGLHKIYPAVSFPVGKGTPMISPLIEWDHDNDYFVTRHFLDVKKAAEQTITVSLNNPEWQFISGHVVDGKILFPGVGYIYLTWKLFSKIEGLDYSNNSIIIENLELKRAIILSEHDKIEFTINIQKGSGSFEIMENHSIVALGRIKKLEESEIIHDEIKILETDITDQTELPLKTADIYKDYRLRGYHYKEQFIGINSAAYDGSTARIKWGNNFITFLDNLIQIFLLSFDSRQLLVPTGIEKITINIERHDEYLKHLNTKHPEFIAHYDRQLSIIKSTGIEIKHMTFSQIQRKRLSEPVTLQKIDFLPFKRAGNHSLYETLVACSEIIKRNVNSSTIQTLELVSSVDPNFVLIAPIFDEILQHTPQTKVIMSVIIESTNCQLKTEIITKSNVQIRKMESSTNERFSLVIVSNWATRKEAWQFCLNALSDGGFLLLKGKDEAVPHECIPKEFDVCLDHKLENERILLCQKTKFIGNIQTICINHNSFDWIQTVRSALKEVIGFKDKRLILYAENDEFSGIIGLSYCLFKEYGTQNLRCYLITDKMTPPFSLHDSFYASQISKDLLVNIYKNGSWGTYSDFVLNKRISKISTHHAELQLEIPGDLSSLYLVEGHLDPLSTDSIPDKALLHIYYSELNFRDVLVASAKLSSAVLSADYCLEMTTIGLGCSGKTANGKRYMTVAKSGCFATLLNQDSDLLIPVPDDWTLEEAATVPVVYLTVIYSFFKTQLLRRGDSILIHSGTGGVGQAAINICLHYGCNIFITVGSPEKREFIRKTFPSIPESHVGCSRDLSFETMIMKETNGRGVDIVLNSLAEEKLLASVKCLAVGGKFIEIGLNDFLKNNPLYMGCFLKGISFHAIELVNFFEASKLEKKHFLNIMIDHMNNGAIKPLKRTVFDLQEAEAAFRYMRSGKHIGKILLRTRQEEADIHSIPRLLSLQAEPKFFCSSHKSYVICGGLGGLGLELIDWLILRGARNLIISSRRGITTSYQRWKIQKWKSRGAKIIIYVNDITVMQGVQKLLEIANNMGPVVAIFNLAMVLKDALFENQTETSFREVAGPKINATIHLDQLSREMCPYLEHFVVFSSVSCGFGNSGQTNYGMANSVMERICEKRKSENLPATAIQWGPMADVGVIVENNMEKTITLEGLSEQPVHSFLDQMNFFLKQPNAVVRSVIFNKVQSLKTDEKNIFDIIGRIFGLKGMEKLDPKSKLTDYGMDSITSIEVKQIFEREFDFMASMKDIKEMTVGRIKELQNAMRKTDNGISSVPVRKEQRAYVKLMRHAFEILTNRIPDQLKIENWDIVLQKLPHKSGNTDLSIVFVFPGFEGYSDCLQNAIDNMNARIYTVQYGSDNVENFQQLVQELAEKTCSILSVKKNFTFIAYSFGCTIAIEVLKVLECQGKVGRIILIDVDLIASCSIMMKLEGTNQLMNESIMQFLLTFWPIFPKSLLEEIKNLPDWSLKVKSVMSQTPINLTYTEQQLIYVLNLVYHRLKVIAEWEFGTEQLLRTLTTSMRPTINLFEENVHYDISKHFLHPVNIQDVEGNHFTMLENVEISDFERKRPFTSS